MATAEQIPTVTIRPSAQTPCMQLRPVLQTQLWAQTVYGLIQAVFLIQLLVPVHFLKIQPVQITAL